MAGVCWGLTEVRARRMKGIRAVEAVIVGAGRCRDLQHTLCLGLGDRGKDRPVPGDPKGESDDSVCVVCFNGESMDDNPIVFCEGCNAAVHQACYGVDRIPEDDWYCEACREKAHVRSPRRDPTDAQQPTCVICLQSVGAFHRLRGSLDWAHVLCTLWLPGTSFDSIISLRGIGLPPPPVDDPACCLCNGDGGYVCTCGGCKVVYHPMCAWKAGWLVDAKRVLQPPRERPPTRFFSPVVVSAYCPTCAVWCLLPVTA